jgi:hypothetical protein
VLLALLVTVSGAVLAYVGFRDADSPDRVVAGYFDALARSDAPAALGYAEVPSGPRTLLTSAVLREQQRIAAIRGVDVLAVDRSGDTARVSVRYELAFRSGSVHVLDAVPVHRSGGSWRMAAAAVPARLHLAAAQRATLAGGAVPEGTMLFFPGAVPLHFDSPYLQLAPDSRYLSFDSPTDTTLRVQVSPAGRQAVRTALGQALESCYTRSDGGSDTCPLPSDRYVPGSLRGAVQPLGDRLTISVGKEPAGVLSITGTATFTGSYQRLTYENVPEPGSGSIAVPVHARAYAVAPLHVRWVQP